MVDFRFRGEDVVDFRQETGGRGIGVTTPWNSGGEMGHRLTRSHGDQVGGEVWHVVINCMGILILIYKILMSI